MANNIWILTEERPRFTAILQIIELYCKDFNDTIVLDEEVKIRAVINKGVFQFKYIVEGLKVGDAENIIIKLVSGKSSFLDFLLFKQQNEPVEGKSGNILMGIEETKTSDDESRNTGVSQRGSKFVYIDSYFKDVKLYMLYNDELQGREDKKPSGTSIFGTNILLTMGIEIVGKRIDKWFKPFETIDELIGYKNSMKQPPASNVPINITKHSDKIEISGRLAKPADAGNIGHDPSIGALSMISRCLRDLGWEKDIVITKHRVNQDYVDRTKGKNKFLYICNMLNLKLDGIVMPKAAAIPELYWHYDIKSEKVATILLHVLGEYYGCVGVYHNHAGCERGYFKTKNMELLALPKKDKSGENLYLPDLILYEPKTKDIVLVEGKQLSKLQDGIEELDLYDSIENEYIKVYYPGCNIRRYVCIYGGSNVGIPHPDVLLYLNNDGQIYINKEAPGFIKDTFKKAGVTFVDS